MAFIGRKLKMALWLNKNKAEKRSKRAFLSVFVQSGSCYLEPFSNSLYIFFVNSIFKKWLDQYWHMQLPLNKQNKYNYKYNYKYV